MEKKRFKIDDTPPKMVFLFGDEYYEDIKEFEREDKERKFQSFCEYLSHGNTQAYARRRAGLSAHQVEYRRKTNSDFAGLMDACIADGTQELEQEAIRRAVEGVEEPVYYKGGLIDVVSKKSDQLLMFLLKARDPKYRETRSVVQADVNTNAGTTTANAFDPTKYTDEELMQLEELLAKGVTDGQ